MKLLIVPKRDKHELWLIDPGDRMRIGTFDGEQQAVEGAREFVLQMASEANRLMGEREHIECDR